MIPAFRSSLPSRSRQGGLHEPGLELVKLAARIAQSGDFDHRFAAYMEPRAGRQPEQIDAARRDVFTHHTGPKVEAEGAQLVEQLGMYQVHLAKVGCVPKSHKAGEVFACRALMDISFDAEGGDQRDPVRHRFGEAVGRASADCRDNAVHWRGFPQQARNNVSGTRFAPATNLSPL